MMKGRGTNLMSEKDEGSSADKAPPNHLTFLVLQDAGELAMTIETKLFRCENLSSMSNAHELNPFIHSCKLIDAQALINPDFYPAVEYIRVSALRCAARMVSLIGGGGLK